MGVCSRMSINGSLMLRASPDDPFADLFSRDPGPRLGPLVGRHRLDPGQVAASDDRLFLADTLRQAREAGNPFLATPDELQEAGFQGAAYRLP
jgi:hypothetical protein